MEQFKIKILLSVATLIGKVWYDNLVQKGDKVTADDFKYLISLQTDKRYNFAVYKEKLKSSVFLANL